MATWTCSEMFNALKAVWTGIFVEKYIKGFHPYTGKERPFLAVLACLQHWILPQMCHCSCLGSCEGPVSIALFVQRAHTDPLNEKYMGFVGGFITCTTV